MKCTKCNKKLQLCLNGKVDSYICLKCGTEYYDTDWGLLDYDGYLQLIQSDYAKKEKCNGKFT